MDNKLPFQEEPNEEEELVVNKSVKLQNKNNRVREKEAEREKFEQRADSVMEKKQERNDKVRSLGAKYMESLRDKTLSNNKSPIAKDLERQTREDLINFAIEINTDHNEDEGMGSVALLALLLKANFEQRDKINDLEYKLEKTNQRLSKIDQLLSKKNEKE